MEFRTETGFLSTFAHRTNRDSGNLWVVHVSGRRSKTWGKTAPRVP